MELSHRFQPIRDVRTGAVIGYEALARIRGGLAISDHLAELASVGPEAQRAFDAASVSGAAARAAAHLHPGQRLFVNVTAATVAAVLAGGEWPDVPPGLPVVWELPEDRAGTAALLGTAELAVLRSTGAELALDDLGEGFADLHRLGTAGTRVWCKLGPSFVRSAAETPRVLDLIRVLSNHAPRIIAEGVESEQTLTLLRRAGVPYAQGYHLGRSRTLPTETVRRGVPAMGGMGQW